MASYYLRSGSGSPGSGTFRGMWAVNTAYIAGDRVTTTYAATAARQFRIYECTTGGTSHATTQPTWDSTPGNTTVDNTVTWTCRAATTWANAHMLYHMLAAGDAAGDTIYVSASHSETSTSAITGNWEGTAASPTRILCVDDTGNPEPPTTLATGAVVATTGANDLIATNGDSYIYGIRFKVGSGTDSVDLYPSQTGQVRRVFDSCAFEIASTNANCDFIVSGGHSKFINCTFKANNTGTNIQNGYGGGFLEFIGGSIEAGGTAPNPLIATQTADNTWIFQGFDFSNLAAAANISNLAANTHTTLKLLNCKMPASWSGALNTGTPDVTSYYILQNSDSADTNYRLKVETTFGTINHDTSIYRTAGASDGTTTISWKMVSTANAEWMHQTLDSPEIVKWNETTGSAITVDLEFLIDSATTLNNNDVWMEVMYLGTSGTPLALFDIDSRAATYLTTATECTAGTGVGNWTGDGGGAKSYLLRSTITPQEKGFIHAVVKLAKASTTIYVDPYLTVSGDSGTITVRTPPGSATVVSDPAAAGGGGGSRVIGG